YLAHAQFVCTTTEIEEHKMGQHAALEHLVAGHRGIEAARHQAEHRLHGAQRKAAEPLVTGLNEEHPLLTYLQLHHHLRVPERYPGRHTGQHQADRKSTRLNSSHVKISYAVFCLKKKKHRKSTETESSEHCLRVPSWRRSIIRS